MIVTETFNEKYGEKMAVLAIIAIIIYLFIVQ
jgi:hypothetical protein